MVRKTQQKSVNKYIDGHYDRINLTVPKGKKAKIQAYAQSHNESVNALINRLLDAEINQSKTDKVCNPIIYRRELMENHRRNEEHIPLPWEES